MAKVGVKMFITYLESWRRSLSGGRDLMGWLAAVWIGALHLALLLLLLEADEDDWSEVETGV